MDVKHIDVDESYGNAVGYVAASDGEQVENYLSEYSVHADKIAAWLKKNGRSVAILKNLNVDEAERGNGYGNSLLEQFLENAGFHTAFATILISDRAEKQREGFVLDRWYEGYDFVPVVPTTAGFIMVSPYEVGVRMREELFPG